MVSNRADSTPDTAVKQPLHVANTRYPDLGYKLRIRFPTSPGLTPDWDSPVVQSQALGGNNPLGSFSRRKPKQTS